MRRPKRRVFPQKGNNNKKLLGGKAYFSKNRINAM
jgi:hypothetical protein